MYKKELSYLNKTPKEAMKEFLSQIKAEQTAEKTFKLNEEDWYIDEHPFNHSDDIIIEPEIVNKYDKFLLIKVGSDRIRIPGWTTKEQLLSTPARDIYRTGKYYHIVFDVNIKHLENFKILDEKLILNTEFIINQQRADSLGYTEMISGILGGLHVFAKEANITFKDLNQKDECLLGDKKTKLYTRDAKSDEDILIPETFFKIRQDIDIYLCVKIKGGNYNYVGFVDKEVVAKTRTVQMISRSSDAIGKETRRIFAEQYRNLSEIIKFYVREKQEDTEPKEMQNFIPLHLHTEYSIGDGFGTPNYIADILYKKGFKGAAITDHGTMAGVFSFQKALLLKGLKPIIGCEFYVKYFEDKRNHITILVKNEKGWSNILKLQKIATENFYRKPLLPFEEIFNYCEGLIILSGCMDSIFHRLIEENPQQVEKYFQKFKTLLGEDFYFEFQPHNILNQQDKLKKILSIAERLNISGVVTLDSHYPLKEDRKYQEAIKSINYRTKFGESKFSDDCFYLMSDRELEDKVHKDASWAQEHLEKWKENTLKILEKIDFKIVPGKEKDTLPKIGESQEQRDKLFLEKVYEGVKNNTPYFIEQPEIKERIELETERIISKQYTNYFLIVEDLISWAKRNDIFVGPGRGSVGASLVAFALNITTCDPIEYNLLFDRFLSEIRKDMPDIDMDFQDDRRQEIFNYLRQTYGADRCAKVITFSRFHPKGILKDIGRIFSIPIKEIEQISRLIIERSGGDARSSFGLMDTFAEFKEAKEFKEKYPLETDVAIKLEGHLRHLGIHAAAMVVTEKPIADLIPINQLSGEIITEFEKFQCEELNLIKFDLLGLRTLSILKDCCNDLNISLPTVFNDEEVYRNILQPGNTLGIFQLNTVGMTKFIQQLKPDNFKEVYDTTTLFRPSALHSGQAQNYINIKWGKTEDTLPFECLRKITEETKGLILYQEQVMQILYEVGDLSWATAEMSRKVMTKSKGKDAMNVIRKEFVINAQKKHKLEKKDAERIFDIVSTFGCLTKDTIIYRSSSNQHKGKKMTIQEAFDYQKSDNFKNRGLKILSMSSDGFIRPHDIKQIHDTGVQEVFYIRTISNKKIKATKNHSFLINGIWKQVKDIKEGDYIETSNLKLPQRNYSLGLGSGNHLKCPRFKKGYYTHREKICEIKKMNKRRQTYDIEMTEEPRNFIANNFVSHNSYGFNKAHAVEYSIISYWCAWLKNYYPENFYKSLLKHEQDDTTLSNVLQEMENKDIFVNFPDINHSDFSFSIFNKKIYSGLNVIKGLGEKTAEKIIKNRPYESREDFIKRSRVSKKILKGLDVTNAFRETEPSQEFQENAEELMQFTKLKPKNKIKDLYDFGKLPFVDLNQLNEKYKNSPVLVRGMVTAVLNKDRLIRNDLDNFRFPFEKHLIYLNLNDGTDNLALQIGPGHYQHLKEKLENIQGQLIVAAGIMNNDGKKMHLEEIEFLKEKDQSKKKITDTFAEMPFLSKEESIIVSAQPRVSKNGKSYYNLILHSGKKGMCFFFEKPLRFGERIKRHHCTAPFLSVWLD